MNVELAQALASNAIDLASELECKAQELQCTLRILGCDPDHFATASLIASKARSIRHYTTGISSALDEHAGQKTTDSSGANLDDYRCQFMAGGQYVATCDDKRVLFTILSRKSCAPYQWTVTISCATKMDVVPVSISVSTFFCGRATETLSFVLTGHIYDASSTSFCRYIG